jgi:hypothetical protein
MSASSDRTGTRGPAPSALNNAIAVFKSKMGISDIRYLLASLDIKPPSYTVLQEKINSTDELITELNKEAMQNNKKLVAEVQTLRGEDTAAACESHCSYNNRPQAWFEAGTGVLHHGGTEQYQKNYPSTVVLLTSYVARAVAATIQLAATTMVMRNLLPLLSVN